MPSSRRGKEYFRYPIMLMVVVGLVVAQLFLVDRLARKLRGDYPLLSETKESVLNKKFLLQPNEIDTLILGDSHAGQSFNNIIIPGWFKATHPGEDLELGLTKLRYYLEHADHIKQVIVPLDYHSLNGSWGVPKQEYSIYERGWQAKIKQYLIKINPLLDDYNRKLVVRWLLTRFSHKYLPLPKQSEVKAATGFEEIVEGDALLLSLVESRAKGMLHPPIVATSSEDAMRKIAQLCAERGISLIGIRYPLPNDFLRYVQQNDMNKIDKWITENDGLFQEIYDYRELFAERQEYFGNEDHLNIPGSNAFTTRFMSDYFIKHTKQNSLPLITKYPADKPMVELLQPGLRILNLETPYGVEQNNEKSWVWIGSGQTRALKLVVYSDGERAIQLRISYLADETRAVTAELNGKVITQEKNENNLNSRMNLAKGLNILVVRSTTELAVKPSSAGTDPRELSVKIERIILD